MESSVVLYEVYLEGIRRLPFKRDAPRAVDMNTLPDGLCVQWMQIVARKIHIPQITGGVQSLQSIVAPLNQFRIHLGAAAGLEQLLQTLVAEACDHSGSVAYRASCCQLSRYTRAVRDSRQLGRPL